MQPTRKHILCVDDDKDTGEMMKLLLERWNYQVTLAYTAAAGRRLAQNEHFDLCLLDTSLPDVSGFELCEQICRVPGHNPVVFVSGAAFPADQQRGLQSGAIAYLTKPLDFHTLETTLAGLLPKTPRAGSRKSVNVRPVVTAQPSVVLS